MHETDKIGFTHKKIASFIFQKDYPNNEFIIGLVVIKQENYMHGRGMGNSKYPLGSRQKTILKPKFGRKIKNKGEIACK